MHNIYRALLCQKMTLKALHYIHTVIRILAHSVKVMVEEMLTEMESLPEKVGLEVGFELGKSWKVPERRG